MKHPLIPIGQDIKDLSKNNIMIPTLILFLIHITCYWGMVYTYDDISSNDFSIAVKNSIKNQLCITLPTIFIFFNSYPITYNNFLISLGCIPILIVTCDIYFYLSHRPLHSKLLWQFHKTHHKGKVCVAKSLDADALEHFIGNLGSFAIGIILLQYLGFIFHIYILYLWVAISTINTCISHSNGNAPYDNEIHNIHHKLLKCNYGTGFYILDRLLGSYRENNKIK